MIGDIICLITFIFILYLCVCSMAVEKYPNNPMLGRREIVDGKVLLLFLFDFLILVSCYYRFIHLLFDFSQPGKYVWQTYQEVYDIVIKLGNSLRSCGVKDVRSIFSFLISIFSLIIFLFFFLPQCD